MGMCLGRYGVCKGSLKMLSGGEVMCVYGAGQRNVWKCTAALFRHSSALCCLRVT